MFWRTRRRARPLVACLRGGANLLRLLPAPDGLLRALARARIGLRALTANRQAAAMADAAIAADLRQALDRLGPLAAQVAFDLEIRVDVVAELSDLLVSKVAHLFVRRQTQGSTDRARGRLANSVDVGQPDFEPLLVRKVDAGDTCHLADHPCFCL